MDAQTKYKIASKRILKLSQNPNILLGDSLDLKEIAILLRRGNINKALEKADNLDTVVREELYSPLRGIKYSGRKDIFWFERKE